MVDYDWELIRTEFEQRMIPSLMQYITDAAIDVSPIDDALGDSPRFCDADTLTTALITVWKSLIDRPQVAPLFAVFAYSRSQLDWERSIKHNTINKVVAALLSSWNQAAHCFHGATRLVVDIIVDHTQGLTPCMAAENALHCSCPVDLSLRANQVSQESAKQFARSNDLLGTEWEDCAKQFLQPVLRAHNLTYTSIHQAANAVLDWAEQGPGAAPSLRRAIATLRRNERDDSVMRDVYAGELRAHRAGLTALLAYIENPDIPQIRFDEARVVYVYPFTVPDLDGAQVCQLAGELSARALGATRRFRTVDTELTDVWSGYGRRHSEYGGVSIQLPSLRVRTTSGEELDHQVEVRLSKLGNHYVRIHRAVTDATLHDLNQALRRVSTAMGAESISEPGSNQNIWDRLPDYAASISTQLVGALRRARDGATHLIVKPSIADENQPDAHEFSSAIDVYLHVLLEVRAASIKHGECDGHWSASTEEIVRAAEALFHTPVQSLPTALEEWARLDCREPGTARHEHQMTDLSRASRFPDDFIGSTYNSTVIVMPNTPNWALLEYEEQIEFAASLPPLLEHWRNQLDHAVSDDSRDLKKLISKDLAAKRFELQHLVGKIRDQAAGLNSINLCGSLPSRRFIDMLYDAAGLSQLQAELDATISRVESTYERMTALIAQRDDHRNRRYQVVVEVILAILAVSSLADVLSLVNSVFTLGVSRTVAWWEIGGLVAAAILTSSVILVLFKLRDD